MIDEDGYKPKDWVLFTPDFDYAKEPYWARVLETDEPVLCYPNAGVMNAMDGTGRDFMPCECEVKFAGWENDPNYPSNRRYQPLPKPMPPTRAERQAAAKRRRKHKRLQRGLAPGEWRMR